jgi:hypothetical protein
MSRLLWRAANQLSSEYARYRRYIDRYVRLSQEEASRETTRTLYQYLTYCRAYSAFWRERWPKEAQEFSPEEANDVLALLPRSVTFIPGARPFPGRNPLWTYPSGVAGWGVPCWAVTFRSLANASPPMIRSDSTRTTRVVPLICTPQSQNYRGTPPRCQGEGWIDNGVATTFAPEARAARRARRRAGLACDDLLGGGRPFRSAATV